MEDPVRNLVWTLVIGQLVWSLPAVAQETWKQHDPDRPQPRVVEPASQTLPVPAPPDAEILFDGTSLDGWVSSDGSPTGWAIKDGAMLSVAGAGYAHSRAAFGDVQLHVEWATPVEVEGRGQDRGNSGVYLMGLYELQVLDSYQNPVYPDGQAGAIYGQHPPLVNASRSPGEWQTFDIFFSRPRFGPSGALLQPARMTVLHNGILIQNNSVIWGPTNWIRSDPYRVHPDRLPIALQDHGNPVRYRNIWVRDLEEEPESGPDYPDAIELTLTQLDRYVGEYSVPGNLSWSVRREGRNLVFRFPGGQPHYLVAHSSTEFSFVHTAATLVFSLDPEGVAQRATFSVGGVDWSAARVPD